MLASRIARIERRGIVLVLVLAMLGLLALIGVTFATFSGQARINNRNYQQSLLQPQGDELLDFALAQLISDTNDIRSVLHGHSLARDMYGTGSQSNGYLPLDPTTGLTFYLTAIAPSNTNPPANYTLTTNIAGNDPNFYGYHFTRWFMRVAYNPNIGGFSGGATGTTYLSPVNQTFEIIADSGFTPNSNAARTFAVYISPTDSGVNLSGMGGTLVNPTLGTAAGPAISQLPGQYLVAAAAGNGNLPVQAYPFILDGRWLSAFNGPGMGANAALGNFRYNGALGVPPPGATGMDEDYDACDLENWFLALQSADGQVMIPSFHRPAVIRYDPNNPNAPVNDWARVNLDGPNGTSVWSSSASRILRPAAADGHDAATFPDLVPDPTTGKITYDVDNDGDGITDSVWLDLGYSARPDSSGRLYKPLFAFMVIGLNGRIPLNTAGNLAGAGSTHADHLGNSVSEVDPTYALQNAYTGSPLLSGFDYDPFNTTGIAIPTTLFPPANTQNTQVDNSINFATTPVPTPIDVRTTQLRNLLAGTRPQPTPTIVPSPATAALNGDINFVSGAWSSSVNALPYYYMPNGIADGADTIFTTDANGNPYVQRVTPPVGGRWGEAQSVPGVPFPNNNGPQPLNLVQSTYIDPVRAGYSFDVSDMFTYGLNYGNTPFPRDAADDNYNAFDPFPAGHTGEAGDSDYYDGVGALLLPVERMRRYVNPADINGTGRVAQWNTTASATGVIVRGPNLGADNFGRVQFSSYFRPAGDPGMIGVKYTYNSALQTITPAPNTTLGAIYYPTNPPLSPDPFYTGVPNPINPVGTTPNPAASAYASYLPDQTNNPFHGFESYKLPNLFQNPGATAFNQVNYSTQGMGGMPIDQTPLSTTTPGGATNFPPTYVSNPNATPPTVGPPNVPTAYPTYDNLVNSHDRSDGMNEADEMNLYQKNPLLDSPYGPSDLEWLYRQQDVDGASLSSRLAQLAPISFTNLLDGQRRRRLVSLDSWETNNFVWANDNPQGSFANNARFTPTQSASLLAANNAPPLSALPPNQRLTPSLAHRDKKINLNYPLPVSNDCNEPIRQKWISDTYQLLKVILPPDSVDTAEELAQLSQYVINIIDFRDPDSTMTHWVNPDVVILPGTVTPPAAPTLTMNIGNGSFDQYGMEYNPVAINETLAYSFTTKTGASAYTQTNRFFIELVNTLTAAYNPNYDYGSPPTNTANNYYGNASVLDLGGFNYTSGDPYSGGCWDLVFTNDDPMSRPDPYRGELVYANSLVPSKINYYGLIPLNRDTFGVTATAPNQGDVTLLPVNPTANNPALRPSPGVAGAVTNLPAAQTTPPTTYFYVIGNPPNTTLSPYTESNPLSTTTNTPNAAVTQTLLPNYDPVSTVPVAPPPFVWHPGILPVQNPSQPQTAPPTNYSSKIPSFPQSQASGARPATNYWVCLRRPANPFAPVSATNPMCVVDSMRFPYIEGTGSAIATDKLNNTYTSGPYNTIYSAQRLQPFRGGHAVAAPNATGTVNATGAVTTTQPPDPRYGYTEQIADPYTVWPTNYGYYFQGKTSTGGPAYFNATNFMYHTLGLPNDSAENWDYLTFNDRDFTSVAELLLVPGCPPGLFTKQFVEAAPSQVNAFNIFATVTPVLTPTFTDANGGGTPGGLPDQKPPVPMIPFSFATASVPFLSISRSSQTLGSPAPPVPPFSPSPSLFQSYAGLTPPVQPHTFPYLVDKFFYTGASGFYYPPSGISTDPSSATPSIPVVGGPAADGWFKMFEFLEVPSQMIGAIGPVAQGANFDWYRQDTKPGLLNINLIIDEEVFFSVFGRQNASFTQTLLNSIELPYLPTPIAMPLSTANNGNPPIPQYGPPVPLVVSAIQASGAPNYVYPLTSQTQNVQHGFLTNDPILQAINAAALANGATPPLAPPVGNRLKAAFAQFLWLRHGGSGYLFGLGSGATGQNSAVATPALTNYTGPTPAERYFRSLSFPDINYTIMRPAALPPSTVSAPAMLPDPNSTNPVAVAVANAQALLYQPPTAPSNWYFLNPTLSAQPYFYAPYVTPNATFTNLAPNAPVVYTGDPGVRNPLLSQGYSTSQPLSSSPYPVYPTQPANTVPAGTPLPVNVAFPVGGVTAPTTFSVVMPPAIPARRLFEAPDAYGTGAIVANGYNGIANLPPPLSNASDSGDPWINNQIPNPSTQTAPTAPTYSLNNGFSTLAWSGGILYPNANSTTPASPATGALPLISTAYSPYSTLAPTTNLAITNAYLGAGSPSPTNTDDRQHPFWRSEQLQKAMNLTTVRTHQYAVWITIGFFEVKRQGDLGMFATNPQLAFDIMGPEIGAANGKTTRFRGFYLVDRLQLTGFNPASPGQFRSAVVYSKRIQ